MIDFAKESIDVIKLFIAFILSSGFTYWLWRKQIAKEDYKAMSKLRGQAVVEMSNLLQAFNDVLFSFAAEKCNTILQQYDIENNQVDAELFKRNRALRESRDELFKHFKNAHVQLSGTLLEAQGFIKREMKLYQEKLTVLMGGIDFEEYLEKINIPDNLGEIRFDFNLHIAVRIVVQDEYGDKIVRPIHNLMEFQLISHNTPWRIKFFHNINGKKIKSKLRKQVSDNKK
jgi:hypothetical protein